MKMKKKLSLILVFALLISIVSSFSYVTTFAIDEDLQDEESVLVDIDFNSMTDISDAESIEGLNLSGMYELGTAPDGAVALKLTKDAENPGSLELVWNNGHAEGSYRIQVEEYIEAPTSKRMQSPIVFSHVRDNEYNNGAGLDITKVTFETSDRNGLASRVYPVILADIQETNSENYLAVNDDKSNKGCNRWVNVNSLVDTGTGSCSAYIPEAYNGEKIVTRMFEDPDIPGSFAPNQLIVTASASGSEHTCDTYISRIRVTGPEGEAGPLPTTKPTEAPVPTVVPVAQDYTIAPLEFSGATGTVTDPAQASALDKVTVIKSEGVQDREFTVLVVEYKDGVFSKLNTAKHEATTEEVSNIDVPVDVKFSAGTTSVKVMLWDSFEGMQPLGEAVTVTGLNVPEPGTAPEPTESADPVEPIIDLNTDTSATNKVTLAQASSGTTAEFKTLGEAIAKAKDLNPKSEEERIVISLMPGVYREINTLETPYITIKKDDAAKYHNVEPTWGVVTDTNKTGTYLPDATKEVILTWYYGTSYTYDSCSDIQKWGACFFATSSASDLIVEDIVFENSFNRYVTKEELADNVTPNSGYPVRKADSDVTSNTFNERSACLYTDAIRAQFIGCKMLGAQDTLGLNGRSYLKNCYIEGRTDYICGVATSLIEDCKLMFYAYSNDSKSGTITAMKEPAKGEDYGVLFKDCYVGRTSSATTSTGSLGRPWAQNAQVTYLNTTYENNKNLIAVAGWGGMSSNVPELATFREYGSKYEDGTAVDLSKRTAGSVLDEWTVLEYNPYNYTAKTDGWDPANVVATYAGVNGVLNETTVSIPEGSSNEVALPAAPAGYEFKWVSNSEYAIVNENGTMTVVRPANGEAPIESTVVLYVRETANPTIGNKKVIPVTIAATTDTENVFTLNGAVSLVSASDVDVNVDIKVYQGAALVKTTNVTIPAGQTSATYSATEIPVGSYTLKYDCTTEYHQVTSPADGNSSVTGAKGETKTIDVTVAGLEPVHETVTTDPTTIGSGVTVTNNGDGSYHVEATKGVTGGAYWNLVDLAGKDLASTETVTIGYRLTINEVFTNKDGANGASIDVTTNTPGVFSSAVNNARALRTLFGRWDQVNMLDAAVGGISGSSNTENLWLNPSGDKFDAKATFPIAYDITVTVDFKTSTVSTTAQTVGKDAVAEYTFAAFPTDINRDNLCLAVYTGSKDKSQYDISNITIDYTKVAGTSAE